MHLIIGNKCQDNIQTSYCFWYHHLQIICLKWYTDVVANHIRNSNSSKLFIIHSEPLHRVLEIRLLVTLSFYHWKCMCISGILHKIYRQSDIQNNFILRMCWSLSFKIHTNWWNILLFTAFLYTQLNDTQAEHNYCDHTGLSCFRNLEYWMNIPTLRYYCLCITDSK